MAFCSNCGNQLPDGAKFCDKCGNKVGYTASSSNEAPKREQMYEGKVHKCPNCGDVLPSFVVMCPSCGYELRGGSTSESIKNFREQLKQVNTDEEKMELIGTFQIPNSKEDIFEFMILAASNFDEDYYVRHKNENDIFDAWLAKLKQCEQKAKIILTDAADIQKATDILSGVKTRIKKAELSRVLLLAVPFICIAIGLVLIMTENTYLGVLGVVGLAGGIALLCVRNKSKSKNQDNDDSRSSAKVQSGFSSWSTGVKVLWIILNIYLIGIPALIYYCCKKR